jgi:hypothetical protein
MGGWQAPQWQSSEAALDSSTANLQERHPVSPERSRGPYSAHSASQFTDALA